MNPNKFNPYKVKFVQKEDIIEEVEDGYSGCLIYKVIRGKHKFFLKIFSEKFDEKKISRLKNILEIYQKLNIKSLCMIDYGDIENENKYYVIYNFIEGVNLRVLTNSENYQLSDIQKMGELIGKEMLKLKNYHKYDEKVFQQKDINSLTRLAITNIHHSLEQQFSKQFILKYFTIEDIDHLIDKVKEYSKLFKNVEPNLIHGDIKRANIMVDENKDLHITDIESMQKNYEILNFRYQMTWCLLDERETAFVKGYFDGIFQNSRPQNFNKQILYMLMINFFNVCYEPEDIEVDGYLKNCRALFERIGKMDLSRAVII